MKNWLALSTKQNLPQSHCLYEQTNFFWATMRDDIRQFIRQCPTCQHIKYETKKPAGLLQPLSIPISPWQDLSLEFITGLPPSRGYTAILMVVDRFTEGAHFGALPDHYTAHKVVFLFLLLGISKYSIQVFNPLKNLLTN